MDDYEMDGIFGNPLENLAARAHKNGGEVSVDNLLDAARHVTTRPGMYGAQVCNTVAALLDVLNHCNEDGDLPETVSYGSVA